KCLYLPPTGRQKDPADPTRLHRRNAVSRMNHETLHRAVPGFVAGLGIAHVGRERDPSPCTRSQDFTAQRPGESGRRKLAEREGTQRAVVRRSRINDAQTPTPTKKTAFIEERERPLKFGPSARSEEYEKRRGRIILWGRLNHQGPEAGIYFVR